MAFRREPAGAQHAHPAPWWPPGSPTWRAFVDFLACFSPAADWGKNLSGYLGGDLVVDDRNADGRPIERRERMVLASPIGAPDDEDAPSSPREEDPEQRAAASELRGIVEEADDALPEGFRVVFVLRAVEEMSVAETAEVLDLPEETVKTRLFRARERLKKEIHRRTDAAPEIYAFHLSRCDRVVARVLAHIMPHKTPMS
jgi:RNA polymerase sigma factor (sigma-70 family)